MPNGTDSSPDILHDTDDVQASIGSDLPVRALAIKFSKNTMIPDESGGLLIKGVPLLAQGTWTDSAVGTPLYYPADTLRQYAENWLDNSVWSRHLGGVPRDITDKVGDIRTPRYENESITGDIYLHGGTQKSRDVIELVKRKLVSFVSVEHMGDERYNPQTRQTESSSLTFTGLAVVNKGACKLCRINEAPIKEAVKEPEPIQEVDTMDTKELETKFEAVLKELAELKAAPKTDPAVIKELEEVKAALAAKDERIKELEAIPVPAVTAPKEEKPRELGTVEFVAVVDKSRGTVRGA